MPINFRFLSREHLLEPLSCGPAFLFIIFGLLSWVSAVSTCFPCPVCRKLAVRFATLLSAEKLGKLACHFMSLNALWWSSLKKAFRKFNIVIFVSNWDFLPSLLTFTLSWQIVGMQPGGLKQLYDDNTWVVNPPESSFVFQSFLSAGKGSGQMNEYIVIVLIGKYMKAITSFEAPKMSCLARADIFCSTSQIISNKVYVCLLQKIHVCTFEDCLGQKTKGFIGTESIHSL